MPGSNVYRQQLRCSRPIVQVQLKQSARHYLRKTEPQRFQNEAKLRQESISTSSATLVEEPFVDDAERHPCRNLLAEISESLQRQSERRDQAFAEMQQIAIELAVAAASYLIHASIEQGQFGLEERIQAACMALKVQPVASIRLNPIDRQLLQTQLASQDESVSGISFNFETGPELPRGTFEICSQTGQTWLSDLSAQLTALRKHWLEELDAAQVERRQTQGDHPPLRRFPDRRETA